MPRNTNLVESVISQNASQASLFLINKGFVAGLLCLLAEQCNIFQSYHRRMSVQLQLTVIRGDVTLFTV